MVRTFTATLMVLAAISEPGLADPVASGSAPQYRKIEASSTVLKKKNGYWVECSYSALGDNCYYVYAGIRAKPGPGGTLRLHRLKADAGKLGHKNGYIVQCDYSGLGDNCYYVYSRTKGLQKAQ